MSADKEYLRSLLSQPWAPAATGKGLLLVDGVLRTWLTDAGGNVHHAPALSLLGIAADDVAAYLVIATDGAVTVWPLAGISDADALVEQALAADTRLHRKPSLGEAWYFGDDEPPLPAA